jgi:hypothetical protein
VISGFRRVLVEAFVLLGCYAALVCNTYQQSLLNIPEEGKFLVEKIVPHSVSVFFIKFKLKYLRKLILIQISGITG